MAFGIAIEVAIGLIFLYLLLSLFATALVELIANGLVRLRQKTLMQGLYLLLQRADTGREETRKMDLLRGVRRAAGVDGFTWIVSAQETGLPATPKTERRQTGDFENFLNTPSIRTTFLAGSQYEPDARSAIDDGIAPSSIAPRQFAMALLEWADNEQKRPDAQSTGDIDTGTPLDSLNYLPDTPLTQSIRTAVKTADNNVDAALAQIEATYQRAIDRITGMFTRKIRMWTLWIAIGLAVAANADTITMTERLWTDRTMREAIANVADTYTQSCVLQGENANAEVDCSLLTPSGTAQSDNTGTDAVEDIADTRERMQTLNEALSLFPLNGVTGAYNEVTLAENPGLAFLSKLIGLGLTAIALSLGAPFWFDLLKRIMSIRAMGRRDSAESDASRSGTAVASAPAPSAPAAGSGR